MVRVSSIESILVVLGTCLTCDRLVAEYRYNAHAQFKVFGDQVKA